MLKSHAVAGMFSAGLIVLGCNPALGQSFPVKPIRLVAQNPGGSGDFAARLISPAISKTLGQTVIVDNRGTIAAIETVAKSPPDGYTILIAGTSLWVAPLMTKDLPYDPVKDFAPITMLTRTPTVLVIHPSLPTKSVKELVSLAKARPGELNFATGGPGTELDGLLFNALAGTNTVPIAYKGTGAALNALIAGEVQLMYANASVAAQHVKSGRLRALAVASLEPSALTPGLPTVAAAVPGYEVVSASCIFAPAKTAVANINRLHQEIVRAVNQPEIKEKFLSTGAEPIGSTPEQLEATIKSQINHLGKVIKEAGLSAK